MSAKTDEILESLKTLSLLEASELVKQIEDAFGVSAAASAGVVMAAPGAAGGGEAAEEKTEFDVVLESFDAAAKIKVLKAVREATGLGLGDAKAMVEAAIESTRDFVDSTYRPAARVAARNGSLKAAWAAVRQECDPKFSDYAIYEHCLPFNVARAYDEARGIETPRIWTAQRDLDMWAALQS